MEVLRDLMKRGLQTPVTMTTDGASGLHQSGRQYVAAVHVDSVLVS